LINIGLIETCILRQASGKEWVRKGSPAAGRGKDNRPCGGCQGRRKVRVGSPPQGGRIPASGWGKGNKPCGGCQDRRKVRVGSPPQGGRIPAEGWGKDNKPCGRVSG
jgi:hypothetical protein